MFEEKLEMRTIATIIGRRRKIIGGGTQHVGIV